ncbi:MAG: 2-oxoglutarate dehydrogenase complex dihydrolipoyllysine-residue succinyltransferase [Myxococcales bacterium]|nr:2-oxoglutarate dehydrogenase complex dihydrolipoyllysine-residue succinyltransferase [Myxococcales bacterium]
MPLIDLVIPSMGESVTSAVIARWLKQVGDGVRVDEPLVSVDSDKATAELPSPVEGVIAELLVAEGVEVAIGTVIGRIKVGDEARPGPNAGPAAARGADAHSPAGPAVRQALHEAGLNASTVHGSGKGGRITQADVNETRASASLFGARPSDDGKPRRQPRSGTERLVALGYTEAEVATMDVDKKHQILDSGLLAAHAAPVMTPSVAPVMAPVMAPSVAPVMAPVMAPSVAPGAEPVEIVPMTTLRRRIAERLLQAQSTAAILTTFNEIDMSAVMALRERHQERFSKKYGIKLGFMSFFVKAAIDALKAFPSANAEIRGTDIVYKRYWHIGVAVSAPRGLVVPVIRYADQLSFAGTEQAIAQFGQRARDGTLTVDDLQGGTFTISNGGTFGSMMSTPILNSPQVAILGMHAIQKRAVVVQKPDGTDEIVIRPMMYVALSYDHRLLDGREAVLTLVRIKECIEDPERILLEI